MTSYPDGMPMTDEHERLTDEGHRIARAFHEVLQQWDVKLDARAIAIALGHVGTVYIGCIENNDVRTWVTRRFLDTFIEHMRVPLRVESVS